MALLWRRWWPELSLQRCEVLPLPCRDHLGLLLASVGSSTVVVVVVVDALLPRRQAASDVVALTGDLLLVSPFCQGAVFCPGENPARRC